MRYTESARPGGGLILHLCGVLDGPAFEALTGNIAHACGGQVVRTLAPEADIALIHCGEARIYARRDLVYGTQLDCASFDSAGLAQVVRQVAAYDPVPAVTAS